VILTRYLNNISIRNKKTFKKLFSQYYSPLCLFANQYIKDIEVSKDVVQEVFEKLWVNNIKITSETTIKSFLYVTVKNACLNYLRHKTKEEKNKNELLYENDDSFFEFTMLEEDIHYHLYKAINLLAPRSKECILLAIKGYSNQEIAEEMNISINSIKTLKQRSYKLLRENLSSVF
jgi:RNA polymerase sigma-70 factor (ECF subfamily)